MFKLTTLMPTAMLRAIYNSSLAELVKRGGDALGCPDHTTITEYGVYQFKLYTEQASYATTWAVYKGDAIICRGGDDSITIDGRGRKFSS